MKQDGITESIVRQKKIVSKRKGQAAETIAYADKAGKRLTKKFSKMMYRGVRSQKIVTAVARELSGFIWGMMIGNTTV